MAVAKRSGLYGQIWFSTRVLPSTQKVTAHIETMVGEIHIRVPVFFGTFLRKFRKPQLDAVPKSFIAAAFMAGGSGAKWGTPFASRHRLGWVEGGSLKWPYDLETCDHAVTNDTDLEKHAVEYDGTLASSNDPFNHIFQGIHHIFFPIRQSHQKFLTS